MKKAVSLILCLLFCAPQAAAQQRNPPPRPRSFFEQNMGITRPGGVGATTFPAPPTAPARPTEKQSAILQEWFERLGIRQGPRPAPTPEQPSLEGWVYGPSAVVQPGPIFSESPVGDGGGGAVSLKGFDSNNGSAFPQIGSIWSKADEEKFNRGIEDIGRIGEGLNQINWPLPSASAPSTPSVRNTEDVTAIAASHRQPDIRRVQTANPSGRATVRSSPGGYIAGSVYESDNFWLGDQFQVKAHKKDKGCWLLGDVVGSPHLSNVWIDCDNLPGQDRANRRATDAQVPDAGPASEADLGRRFASIVLPSTNCPNSSRDSKYLTDVKRDIAPNKLKLYGNYNPVTHQLTDEINTVEPGHVLKVRYLSNDHLAAAVNYVVIDAGGNKIVNQWGFVSSGILALPLREDTTPCVGEATRWP